MRKMILRSIHNKENLEMIYLSNDNQVTQRVIRVLKISDEMIMAFCYTKRTIRTFKLDNILSVGSVRKRMGA